MNTTHWRVISTHPHELGEGLRETGGTIRWVDLLKGQLYAWKPTKDELAVLTHALDRPLGVVEQDTTGRLIAAFGTGIAVLGDDGIAVVLAETGLDAERFRVNDGNFAPDGTFWFGTMVHDGSPAEGAVWRWDPISGNLDRVLTGIDIPNGPAFLPNEETVLVADSAGGRILRTAMALTSEVRLHAEVLGGSPDGMHVDSSGRLWNAVWGGSRLDVYPPGGSPSTSIALPVSQPTSVLLTTGDDPLVLVTSATLGLPDPGPLDGHTLAAPLSQLL